MLALYRIVRHVMLADILKVIGTAESRVPAVLRALKTARRYRDQDIAEAMGMSRSAVQARMTGITQCSPGELAGFAVLFDVPVGLFYDPPSWVTPPQQAQSGCTQALGNLRALQQVLRVVDVAA